MSSAKGSAIKVLEGPARRLEIHAEAWAKILLLVENWGWKPTKLRMTYLAGDHEVPETDARNLSAAGQRILDAALADPTSVYPADVDMGKLYEVVEFCKAGSFRICR